MQESELIERLVELHAAIKKPYWQSTEFWLSTALGIAGVWFSVSAWFEARAARRAAVAAGRNVKVQTVAIELSEVAQRLDRIDPTISFTQARDLLAEVGRKLRRLTSPFADDQKLRGAINALAEALDLARQALAEVKPLNAAGSVDAPQAVYYAIEQHFSRINDLVADLVGLFEKSSIVAEKDNGNQ